jgi:hypothetical protein
LGARLGRLNFIVGCVAIVSAGSVCLEAADTATQRALIGQYCNVCHNPRLKSGGLSFDSLDLGNVSANPVEWEKVVTKLRAGMMPPAGARRPDEATYDGFRMFVQTELDKAAAARPDPGRTEIFHRLNRGEYQNAIRDLLALDIDADKLLPADDSSNGFDNMAGTLRMSQSLMERYLSAAKTISRMAVGDAPPAVESKIYRVSADLQQYDRMEGLPFGSRGGTLIRHLFPRDAEYEIKIELAGARAGTDTHQLEVSVDGGFGRWRAVETVHERTQAKGAGCARREIRDSCTGDGWAA